MDNTLLSFQTSGKVSASTQPARLILLAQQMLMTPAVKKIFSDTMSGIAWNNNNTDHIIRTGVIGTTPGKIGHAFGISKTSSPGMIGNIGTTDQPCGLNASPDIDNIRISATPYLRTSNKKDTYIDPQFTNNLVALLIFF